jgi:hypothetical protein
MTTMVINDAPFLSIVQGSALMLESDWHSHWKCGRLESNETRRERLQTEAAQEFFGAEIADMEADPEREKQYHEDHLVKLKHEVVVKVGGKEFRSSDCEQSLRQVVHNDLPEHMQPYFECHLSWEWSVPGVECCYPGRPCEHFKVVLSGCGGAPGLEVASDRRRNLSLKDEPEVKCVDWAETGDMFGATCVEPYVNKGRRWV